MGNIINILNQEGQLVVTSREISANFGKRHDHTVDSVEEIIKQLGSPENWGHLFIESQYQHEQNKQWYKEYLLTRDGFSLLVMGFTGQKALQWKLKYIEAFNNMEKTLKNPKEGNMKIISLIHAEVGELIAATTEIKNRVTKLEEEDFVKPFQKKALINARTKKVLSIFGGKESEAYKNKSFRSRVYQDIFRNIKNIYNINEYDAIPKSKFSEAMKLVNDYSLPLELKYELEKINTQISISEEAI